MEKLWRWRPTDIGAVEDLSRSASISPIVAQMLVARGVFDSESARAFLQPKMTDLRDPELLPGLTQAADMLFEATRQGKSICIYGDYDADGMTATSILVNCLKALHANVSYFVPNRLEDAYGISKDALRKLASHGKQTIVSVDCGIGSIEEAKLAKELGLELIITDHHTVGSELPEAAAIVHPALPGFQYPFAGLCGAGVAFKLAWAVCQRYSNAAKVTPELREFLLSAMGLAAIGTVADVVPLLDENRALVKHGLISLCKRPSIGIQALLKEISLHEKNEITSENVGFAIAPRLNAAGRLGQAQLAVELMTTNDPQRAEALAIYINKLNEDRKTLEQSVYIAASKQIKEQCDLESEPALVLAGAGWHAGVIGIVAGRIAEKYQRPTVIIALDAIGQKPGVGSARSAGYIDLHHALEECRGYLVSCGGHAAAAGLRVEESNLAAFRQAFQEAVSEQLGNLQMIQEVHVDAQATLNQLDLATVLQIEQMAPFGSQNPRPLIAATRVKLPDAPKTMGQGDKHFSARFVQHGSSMRAVAFGQADWVSAMSVHWNDENSESSETIDIVFRPVINDFNGMRKVEMHLVDWRPSPASKPKLDPLLS